MKKLLFGLLVILVITSLMISCKTTTTPALTSTTSVSTTSQVSSTNTGNTQITTVTSEPTSTTPLTVITTSESNWWDKFGTPEYGGTLTLREATLDVGSFDSYSWLDAASTSFPWSDPLFANNWTYDRAEYGFKTLWTPESY
jgi:hypothetical protein